MLFSYSRLIVAAIAIAAIQPLEAQSVKRETAPAELVRTITALDSAMFDAYNHCDLVKFASFWNEDSEFFHDQGGLMIGGSNITEAVKNNICRKVTRELVPGTLEVYIMKGYGALEIGVHRFHHPGRDDTEPVGEAKFIQLWQNQNGKWKITRTISFDHHSL